MGDTRWLTVPQYAELMQMHPQAVRDMCADGTIPAEKVGRRWRIPYREPPQAQAEAKANEILNEAMGVFVGQIDMQIAALAAMRESLVRRLEGET